MINHLEASYQNEWIVSTVNEAVMKVNYLITDTSKLENRIHVKIGKYITEVSNAINNKRRILRMIHREIKDAINKKAYKTEETTSLESLRRTFDDGDELEYEHEDVLANVNSASIELTETIALLAKDDRRKKLVLNEWVNGNTCDTSISRVLANALNGNARSHCRFVQRFRLDCRRTLETAI